MATKRKVTTAEFLATHPVFSLPEATEALAPAGGTRGAVERLKYHVKNGRLRRVARGVYAVVPRDVEAARFSPDAFLVADAIRPEGVFCHHSALQLLGAAHSVWNQVTLYTHSRRPPLLLDGLTLRFLDPPKQLAAPGERTFATRRVEHRGRVLCVTGPERTLVEGLRRPDLAGGLEELVVSAGGFPVLDLPLLEDVLRRFGERKLWAAAGWFLERFQSTFHVPDATLQRLERLRPDSARYLLRDSRGGTLAKRWNLIVPEELTRRGEPDER
jgi:predicted transcriptional regulator of viral defense system